MLVYKLFDGREFYDSDTYDRELENCMNKYVRDFHPRHMTRYVQEFMKDIDSQMSIVNVEGGCAEAEHLRIIKRFPIDGSVSRKTIAPSSEHIAISVYVTIPEGLLLKDFRQWVESSIEKMFGGSKVFLNNI